MFYAITKENTAPDLNFLDSIILTALEKNASDIHIQPSQGLYFIKIRVDGVLQTINAIEQNVANQLTSKIKVLSMLDIAEKRLSQDGSFSVKHNGATVELRISTCSTIYGERVAVRILYGNTTLFNLKSIGLFDKQYKEICNALSKTSGAILFTGPTGSGKTSTIYSALKEIDTAARNILTVEDPVEINLENISQTNINPKIGLDFATIMRSFLRQDPDIIMLGEIRDSKSANIAFNAALTGHLIISTLHTFSAKTTLTRLEELGVSLKILKSCINLIVNQRLIRILCDFCKQAVKNSEYSNKNLNPSLINNLNNKLYKANGCDKCNNGYKGRAAVFEIIKYNKLNNRFQLFGNTLATSIIRQVNLGVTSIEEYIRVL